MAQFSGWLFVNVLVPVLAPLVLLLLLKIPRSYASISKGIVTRAVQDGQLFWTLIPMAAAACYEAGVAIGNPASTKWIAWIALVYHFLVIVGSAVLVMLGTAASSFQSTEDRKRAAPAEKNLLLTVSVWATLLTMFTFAAVHLGFA